MATPNFDMYTDRARKAIDQAAVEAERLGHHYVGTEHLLLGLLADSDSIAAGVLQSLRVDPAKVRTAIEFILSHDKSSPPPSVFPDDPD
jgi:ATP-dependent Clp protease ATP-binding subunit ClpC